MAQIIPPITSLPIDSSAAPSVEDIQDRLPSICVDYLSHDWSEEDVWASWRSMTRHKHEIANGVRLENASWRTWQKQRNKLKTISPETLNWLKDSDVTWLYGPLHTAQVEPVRPLKVSGAEQRLGLDPGVKKPILKHRTLSEMLTIHTPSSPILEAAGDDMDLDELERPPLYQTKSDTNIMRARSGKRRSPSRAVISDRGTPAEGASTPAGDNLIPTSATGGKRHISFNTFVEQVIAVDDPTDVAPASDSDDEVLEIRSSNSASSRSSRPSISRNSSSNSTTGDHLTIAKIAPTMLKTNGVFHSNLPAMVYAPPPQYVSPNLEKQSAFDFPSPQPQAGRRWGSDDDDEEYSSVGFDYFAGPDYSSDQGPSAYGSRTAPSHYGRTQPVEVQNAPVQPKWRSAAPALGPETASTSSSSSSSSVNIGLNSTSPQPQPGRSILKVRPPPGSVPIAEESNSPPNSTYFNYNPSVATGIGGMRGVGHGPSDIYGPSGSPTSPIHTTGAIITEGSERGRSTSRDRSDRSSSSFGRSSSGSHSVGSSSSISPGAPRSPNELPSTGHQKPLYPTQTARQTQQQQLAPRPAQPPAVADNDHLRMDVDQEYSRSPVRSDTPTPHSSPQIPLRSLKDTSPASLPHHPGSSLPRTSSSPALNSSNPNFSGPALSPELPRADPAKVVSPRMDPNLPRSTGRATTAHVGTNAAPTIVSNTINAGSNLQSNQNQHSGSGSGLYPNGNGSARGYPEGEGDVDMYGEGVGMPEGEEGDGSSIIGRAANIAGAAKGLLGALWYGPEGEKRTRK